VITILEFDGNVEEFQTAYAACPPSPSTTAVASTSMRYWTTKIVIFATSTGRAPAAARARPTLANTWRAWAGQVTETDEVALFIFGFLAGDEDQPASGRDDDMGVGQGSGQVLGIDAFERLRLDDPLSATPG
jgi:hypothetical protein